MPRQVLFTILCSMVLVNTVGCRVIQPLAVMKPKDAAQEVAQTAGTTIAKASLQAGAAVLAGVGVLTLAFIEAIPDLLFDWLFAIIFNQGRSSDEYPITAE